MEEPREDDDTAPAAVESPIPAWLLQETSDGRLNTHGVIFTVQATALAMARNLDKEWEGTEPTRVVRVMVTPRAGRASCWYEYTGQLAQYEHWTGAYTLDTRTIEELHASVGYAQLKPAERQALGLNTPIPAPPEGWVLDARSDS